VQEEVDKILLFDLDEDDAAMLLPNIPSSDHELQAQQLRPGQKGEPTTTLIAIAVTAAALKGWVAFLTFQAKKRSFRYSFEIQRANGDKETRRIEILKSDHPNLEKEIISKLTDVGVDMSLLKS
jgi:hypothetical protein